MKGDRNMNEVLTGILSDFLDKFVALLIEHLGNIFGDEVSAELNKVFGVEMY